MIEPLEGLPEHVIGFRAVGTVEPDDYKNVLDPAIDAVLDQHEKIRFVYVVGDDFDRYSLGAMWQDTKLGVTRKLSVWERVAFVTDHDWLKHAGAIFAPMMPGEFEVFPLAQLGEAIAWAAG